MAINELRTPEGELYGFAYNGEIYLDETKIDVGVPIHEYTHLWDAAVQRANPKLWQRGKELMKKLTLWKEMAEDENYGKKWKAEGKTHQQLEDLIASEVHARLVGPKGEEYLQGLKNDENKVKFRE